MKLGRRFLLLLALVPTVAIAQTPPAILGPFMRIEHVNGIEVSIPTRFELSQRTAADAGGIDVRVVAGLDDLAAKIGPIIERIHLPQDRCAHERADNPVVSLKDEVLGFKDGALVLSISGRVEVWGCTKNPVPGTKVVMKTKDIGMGIKTKVPVLVDVPQGEPITIKLGAQRFDADVPITLVKDGDRAVRLQLGEPDIRLKGKYASVAKDVLSASGFDLDEQARVQLEKAIDPDRMRLAVPAFDGFDPIVKSAGFVDDNSHIAASVTVTATMSPALLVPAIARLATLIQSGQQAP